MKIAIVNQKGGSGKSTLAVLIAKAFADAGQHVTLVDTDPQGGSSALFGVSSKPDLTDYLMESAEAAECVHPVPGWDRLSIVPADHRLDSLFVSANPFTLQRLSKALGEEIIFDTAPTCQGLSRAAVIAADRVWIPAEVSETALGPTLYTVEQVRELDQTPEVLLSGYREPEELKGTARNLAERFRDALGPCMIGTIPRTVSAAKLATAAGKWTRKTRESIEQPLLSFAGQGGRP